MSFDIKYNRDGQVIKNPQMEQELTKSAEPTPAPVQAVPLEEVLAETQTESAAETVEIQAAEPETTPEIEAPAPQETAQAKNFRAIRERAERAERERDELMRMLSQEKPHVQQPEQEEDLNFNVDSDALVEGKHLSKVDKKIKILERKLAQYEQRSTETNAETRLKSQYSDFDSVVTAENIMQFKEQYPELAQALNAAPDLYAKGKSAYVLLKKFGIAQDPITVAERAVVQKNAAKPKPVVSISAQQGNSPLSQANAFANGLTKDLQEQLQREMYEARRNL